jgi:hypothetical protein
VFLRIFTLVGKNPYLTQSLILRHFGEGIDHNGGFTMDLFLSIAGLVILLIVVFIIARFVLKLAGTVIGCVMTALVALGILVILWIFVF